MNKIEIELTDEQLEKVEHLQSQDISVGKAIDMLFEIKEKALPEIEQIDKEISLLEKVKETTFDVDNKAEILDENYGDSEKTYEMKIQDVKHKIKWGKEFFKF
ncbi:hypothetical protein [Methanobrevibacter sp.]|uniref:hypothetical protein n=1 Tax=Methanobrevibacter sp. TaxID=66852 RepID=UPI0026DEF24D|nr:hypothetical protein [Methanobrevibacter sp.]MDO5823311.1 hypothetical protein [Methanobrevibacter sp.]